MRRILGLLCLALLGCGGSNPPTKTPDVKVGKGDDHSAVAAANEHGPSKALAARWPFKGDVRGAAYIDVAAVTSTQLVKGLLPLIGAAGLPDPARKCIDASIANAKELLGGKTDDGEVVVLRVEGDSVQNACTPLLAGSKPADLKGARVYPVGKDGDVVAFQPGFVIAGDRDTVSAVLAGASEKPPALGLAPDEVAVVTGHEGPVDFRAAMAASDQRFALLLDAKVPSKLADELESEMKQLPVTSKHMTDSLKLDADSKKTIERLTNAVTFKRNGEKVHVQFELAEPPADQARDIGFLSTMSVYAVRSYIANAKTAEARNAIAQIGRDMAAWYESEELAPNGKTLDRKAKKLWSIAPTPKTVPKGVKYQSSRDDWKPWEKLRFELSSPQYYQYEVKAAKDGRSADVIARGDLNGDGKTSEFLLHVEIKDDRVVMAPAIKETDPQE